MADKLFEIKFKRVSNLNSKARKEVEQRLLRDKPSKYQGFAKTVITTSSQPKVISVEPIEGTIIDYLESIKRKGGKDLVF